MSPEKRDDIAKLIEPFSRSSNFYTRYHTTKSLARLGRSSSAGTLADIALDGNEDIDLRIEAIAGLAKTAGKRQVARMTRLLADPSGEIRTSAAAALAEVGDEATVDGLIEALIGAGDELEYDEEFDWDPQWDVQLETVKALGNIGDARAVAPIIDFYEEEKSEDISQHVFTSLCRIGSPQAQTFLRETLKKGEPLERKRVAGALGEHPLEGLMDDLRMALMDKAPETRVNAAKALAMLGDENIKTQLFLLFKDESELVRGQVLGILAGKDFIQGHEEHVTPLLEDSKPTVRAAAARALQHSPMDAVGAALERMAEREIDEEALMMAVSSLVAMGAPAVPNKIAELIGDKGKSAWFRIQLVKIVGTAYPERVVELVGGYLTIEPRQVAVAVAAALAKSGDRDIILKLVETLAPREAEERENEMKSGDPETDDKPATETAAGPVEGKGPETEASGDGKLVDVEPRHEEQEEEFKIIGRKMAVRSPGETPGTCRAADIATVLAESNRPEAVEALIACLPSDNGELATNAARSLGALKAENALPALGEALEAGPAQVRGQAALAIGRIGGESYAQKLGETLASDHDEQVREKAAQALGMIPRWGGQVEKLIGGMSDPAAQVRKECIAALGGGECDEAAAPLIDALFDFDRFSNLRQDICAALKQFDENMVKDRLLSVLNDESRPHDQWIVIETFGEMYA